MNQVNSRLCVTGSVTSEDDRSVPTVVIEFKFLDSPYTTLDAMKALANKLCALNGGSEPFALYPVCLTDDVPCLATGHPFICILHKAYNQQ